KKVGDAFLTTSGQTVFSARAMMDAYGPVSGQFAMVAGHALTGAEALKVMNASAALASATGTDLGTATKTLAGVMQAFQLPVSQAAHATDVLYAASTRVGMPVADFAAEMQKLHSKLGDVGGSLPQLSTMMVDLANHGVTGKAAIGALTTATNTLLSSTDKNSAGYVKAKDAYDKAEAAMAKLKDSHHATTAQIATAQATLDKAKDGMDKLAQGAGQMGLKVYDSKGSFVGMQSIIEQLQPKLKGMTDEQRRTA